MLIRVKQENILIDFTGNGIFFEGGYICCSCGGRAVHIKASNEFNQASKLLDEIQNAYLSGEKIFVIE